jgi:hypothetical protein
MARPKLFVNCALQVWQTERLSTKIQ